jgi:hypothetical protein
MEVATRLVYDCRGLVLNWRRMMAAARLTGNYRRITLMATPGTWFGLMENIPQNVISKRALSPIHVQCELATPYGVREANIMLRSGGGANDLFTDIGSVDLENVVEVKTWD